MRRSRNWLGFLAGHLAAGTLAAAVFIATLLATDTLGLAALVRKDGAGSVAVVLLSLGVWVTFGSLALGAGIMGLGRPRSRGAAGGGRPQAATPVPVRLRSGSRSSR